MQRREGYTTLTICQPLWKTSRNSFQSEERERERREGKKKEADMNKQFLLTLL